MMKIKAMLVSLIALAVVLTWTVSVSANLRPLDSAAAVSQRALPIRITRDVPDNTPPTAEDQDVVTNENTPALITLEGNDDDDDPLTFEIVDDPENGTLDDESPDVTYTPDTGFHGTDSFTFKVFDQTDYSDPAVVSITVTQDNIPPTAEDQDVVTNKNTARGITLTGDDLDGDPLAFEIVDDPENGTLGGDPPNVTYTTDTDYYGLDSFTFKVNDGTADSNTATVSIKVNAPPTANNQSVVTNKNTAKAITLTGNDLDGGPLTYTILTQPANGSLAGAGAIWNYTPSLDFNGLDSFTFKVNDNTADSNTATVSIKVNALPTANSQIVTVVEDTPTNITLSGTDPDGDELTYLIVTPPTHGTVSGGTGATRTYTPNTNYNGPDSFTFKVNDGLIDSAPATVTITVNPVNDPPVLDLDGNAAGTGFSTTHAAGKDPTDITSDSLTITDLDNNALQSATVKINNLKHPGNEFLDADVAGTGITKSYNPVTGELTLNGPAFLTNFQTVLRSVTYQITGVTAPNTEKRNISFRVSDGPLQSNEAVSEVKIIAPRISISATTFAGAIPVGGAATFEVKITNNGGSNVDLKNIKVTSSDENDNCDKTIAGTLAPGATSQPYTCQRNAILTTYDNIFTVTAEDVELETPVNATSTATVRVVSGIVVDIYHMTGENTLAKGQDAEFRITVTNPTGSPMNNISTQATIEMYDVDTESYLAPVPVPACSRADIADLDPGGYTDYLCTVPDVQGSFRIRVDAAGSVLLLPYTDFDSEDILVPDLSFEVSADPFSINAGEPTLVEFTLTMTNRSNVPLTLSGLQSDRHGNLLTGQTNNTCPGIDTLPENVTRTCSYEAMITAEPPSFINSITVIADYTGGSLNVTDEAVIIAGDITSLDVSLVAKPSSLVAPGGDVDLTASVTNNTASDLLLDELNDSELGSIDGLGDCDISQPIPANGTYTCTYPVTIENKVPGDVVTHTLTAVAGSAHASGATMISITTEIHTQILLPTLSKLSLAGEPYNSACGSMPMMPNLTYYGLADDAWDWYRFTITAPAVLNVQISNFLSEGHLLAYSGDCSKPQQIGHVGAPQGTILPNREIVLGLKDPGTYYVAVSSTSANRPFNTTSPYALTVEATTP